MEKTLKGISKYKKKIRFSKEFHAVDKLLKANNVNTICHSAMCPNIGECFLQKKLTFLILGDTCTRNCSFCNVATGIPGVDPLCTHSFVSGGNRVFYRVGVED